MHSHGMTEIMDHDGGIKNARARSAVAQDDGTIRRSKLWRSCPQVNRNCLLRLDRDGRKTGLGSVGCSQYRHHGQIMAGAIVLQLEFTPPTGLSGPVNNELFNVFHFGRNVS